MGKLYKKLWAYSESDYYGFHMPGHKGNCNVTDCGLPYSIDITEIEGFDDLHHSKGIIREAEEQAAKLYRAEETHYLINGSTAGILSAILGCTSRGDKILAARNCHKSVYHAVYLQGLYPLYVYPKLSPDTQLNKAICVIDIERALEKEPDIKAVVVTSPTYDGVVSDIKSIAQKVHKKGIPLIVDEAHGAHFGFHPYFPQNANTMGADVVIHSLHKTLPALTQTALIHINGSLAPKGEIRQYLQMLQTSSPSYVLMASMDTCMNMIRTRGKQEFERYTHILEEVRQKLAALKHLRLIETENFDRSKIVISAKNTGLTGRELCNILLQTYHLQMEMASQTYILAMTSIGDTQEGMDRLLHALTEIDAQIDSGKVQSGETEMQSGGTDVPGGWMKADRIQLSESDTYTDSSLLPELKQVYTSAEIGSLTQRKGKDTTQRNLSAQTRLLEWENAVGRTTVEYAYIYPPGIPLFVPGEELSQEVIELLRQYEAEGFTIEGLKNERKVEVLEIG